MKEIKPTKIKIHSTVIFDCPCCERTSSLSVPESEIITFVQRLRPVVFKVTCYNEDCGEEFLIKLNE